MRNYYKKETKIENSVQLFAQNPAARISSRGVMAQLAVQEFTIVHSHRLCIGMAARKEEHGCKSAACFKQCFVTYLGTIFPFLIADLD